jgi:hypothetical protein
MPTAIRGNATDRYGHEMRIGRGIIRASRGGVRLPSTCSSVPDGIVRGRRVHRYERLVPVPVSARRIGLASSARPAILQLHALAYNLGNFLRTLATPEPIKDWSLTSLKEKLIKIGAKVVSHGRYVVFQMAEVAIPRNLFADILRLIVELRPPPITSIA